MRKSVAVVLLWVAAGTQVAACSGGSPSESEEFGKSVASCLRNADLRARFIDFPDGLFVDQVHHRTDVGTRATIRLFDTREEAQDNYDLLLDEFLTEPSRFVLIDNMPESTTISAAIVRWGRKPTLSDGGPRADEVAELADDP
jgi:hypothetical protein